MWIDTVKSCEIALLMEQRKIIFLGDSFQNFLVIHIFFNFKFTILHHYFLFQMVLRLTLEKVREVFKSKGCELLSETYKNNASALQYRCRCGTVCTTPSLSNFKKSESCKDCGLENYKKTCIQRYGVPHSSQSEKVKVKFKKTMIDRYGVIHPSLSKELINRRKETYLQNFGVEHHAKSEETKEKIRNTNKRKRGVGNVFQDPSVREKAKQTLIKNYGVEHPTQHEEIKAKVVQTMVERYGITHPFQSEEFKQKYIQTSMNKFGVSNPMQNQDILQKQLSASYRTKSFILPSGKVMHYQGYENFLLQDFLAKGISEFDIIDGYTKKPSIRYNFENKDRVYFPDMYLVQSNTIYEVKSDFTYKVCKEKTYAKIQACIKSGYNVELIVYNKRGNIITKENYECLQ